jgi:hypothetical protein
VFLLYRFDKGGRTIESPIGFWGTILVGKNKTLSSNLLHKTKRNFVDMVHLKKNVLAKFGSLLNLNKFMFSFQLCKTIYNFIKQSKNSIYGITNKVRDVTKLPGEILKLEMTQ